MDSSKGETAMNDAAVAAPRHSHDDTQQKTPNSEVSHRGGKRGSLHSFQHSRPHGRHTVTLVPFERPPTPLRSIEEFMPVWRRQRTPTPTPTDPRPPTPLRSYEEAPPRCVENTPAAEPERPPTPLEAYEEVPVTAVTVAPVDRPPTPLRSYEEVTRGGERTLAAETVEEGPVQPLRSFEEIKRGGERTVMAAPIDDGRPPTPLRGFEIVKPCVAAPIHDERPATPLRSFEVVTPCGQRTVMDAPIERPPTPLRGFEIIKPCVAAPINDEALPAPLRSYEEVTRGGERTLAAETVEESPVQPLRSFEEIRPGGERTVMAAPIDDGRPPTPLRGFEEVHPAASDRSDAVTVPIKDDRPPSPLRSVEEVEPRTISQSHPTTNAVEETADVAPLHTFEEVPPSSPDQAVAASAAHVDAAAAADAPSEEVIPLESFEEVLPRCAPPAEEEPTHAVASTAGGVSPEQATNTTGAAVDERPRTPLESWECISSVTTRRRITYASVGAQTDAVVEVPPSTMGEPASAVAAERRVTPGEAEAEHTAAPEDTSEAVEPEVGAAATHEEALEEPFIEPVVAEQPVKEAEAVTDEPVEHTEAAHSITEEHAEEPVMERERDDLVEQDRPPETEHVYTQVGAEEPVTCDAEKRIEEPQEHDTVLCEGDATKPIQEEAPLEEGVASVHDENMEASQEKCVVSEDAPATPSELADDRVDEAHSQHDVNQPDTHAIHSDGEPTGAPVDAAPPQEKEEPAVVPVECVRETPLNYAESAQQSQQPHQQNASDLPLMTPEPQQEEGRSRYAAPPRRSPEGEREIDSAADDHIRRLSDRSGLTSHPGDLPVEQAVHDEPAVGPAATHFVHGKPSVAGDKMVPCFEIDNGLLFRITDSESGKWGFYNDTDEYIMHVRFSLGRKSRVVPLGSMVIQEDPETGRFEGEVMLHPGCTEMVFMGHVNGHRMRYYAIPTSREYHA